MVSVWEELKRRNVVKVAVAYAIVGWNGKIFKSCSVGFGLTTN